MNENSFPVQLLIIASTLLPIIYLAIVHVNILETIIAYLVIILASSVVFKKWYMVLNMASFLVVLTFIFSIGGTL